MENIIKREENKEYDIFSPDIMTTDKSRKSVKSNFLSRNTPLKEKVPISIENMENDAKAKKSDVFIDFPKSDQTDDNLTDRKLLDSTRTEQNGSEIFQKDNRADSRPIQASDLDKNLENEEMPE